MMKKLKLVSDINGKEIPKGLSIFTGEVKKQSLWEVTYGGDCGKWQYKTNKPCGSSHIQWPAVKTSFDIEAEGKVLWEMAQSKFEGGGFWERYVWPGSSVTGTQAIHYGQKADLNIGARVYILVHGKMAIVVPIQFADNLLSYMDVFKWDYNSAIQNSSTRTNNIQMLTSCDVCAECRSRSSNWGWAGCESDGCDPDWCIFNDGWTGDECRPKDECYFST